EVETPAEDGSDAAVAGVTVADQGNAIAAATDVNGQCNSQAHGGDVFVFCPVGCGNEEGLISSAAVNIVLQVDDSKRDEVIVVGYGTQKKRSITGSVASVNYDEFKDRSFSNVVQSLSGTVPGVNITQSQGAPGAAPVVQIRGISSITAGTNPLFVVD